MKQKDLEQVYYLKKELNQWQKEYSRLQAEIALSPKQIDGMPFTKTNKTNKPTEDKALKLAETQKVIEGKMAEIQLAILEVETFITEIDDSFTRQVVYNRCVRCLSWQEIAFEFGEGYTDATIRQHYHRYIKRLFK